ncbi:hypothetical protein ACIQC9_14190 [Brevundimonas sp. NPDC092305]|uniref:hypothetical protein n=1 Tax=Brevundimonas sp. NPDC092305 TaxID=3363957 RepID=UPI00381CCF1B
MRTLLLAAALTLAASATQAQTLREHPVTTPVPPNAVDPGAGMAPAPGTVRLRDNMPGHRRFRAPLFPNAGWDSPMRADGEKDYDRYLVEYWRAPYLPADHVDPNAAGMEQRGHVAPEPWPGKVERSRATPEQDALFERRMQFLAREVLNAVPFRNLHGASIEPELIITGYGQQHGAQGDGVMRGEIRLQFRHIMPSTGNNQRMPDGTIKSGSFGPTLTLALNPTHLNCSRPVDVSPAGARCLASDSRLILATDRRMTVPAGTASEPRLNLAPGAYGDRRPATDIRVLEVSHNRRNNNATDIDRGRMHPHDALGRIIGAINLLDWNDLLRRAAEVQ